MEFDYLLFKKTNIYLHLITSQALGEKLKIKYFFSFSHVDILGETLIKYILIPTRYKTGEVSAVSVAVK